jgi:oxygen-independent coproporphyrinogen-3 oxidase
VNYWRGGDYLGLGAGAHSYKRSADDLTGRRWSNEKSPAKYMAQVAAANQAVIENEVIEATKAAAEFMFLGLRMTAGISIAQFRSRFGIAPAEMYPRIQIWLDGDFMIESDGFLRLTAKGLLMANSIFVEFM